jgi:hypothetical protein
LAVTCPDQGPQDDCAHVIKFDHAIDNAIDHGADHVVDNVGGVECVVESDKFGVSDNIRGPAQLLNPTWKNE